MGFLVLSAYGQEPRFIPYPQEIKPAKGNKFFRLDPATKITCTVEGYDEAKYLQHYIKELIGSKPAILALEPKAKDVIELTFAEDLTHEAYELIVSRGKIEIKASGKAGWFYGIQTLIQLVESSEKNGSSFQIMALQVKDGPRFPWRAFMLDEARYFKGKKHVMNLLDEMAHLKLNTFHWHLTDDAGWRIEIKKYPKLTEIGSYRKSTRISNGKRWQSKIESGEPHMGFYTQDDIREIIAYARERHITIVPEIEMPGHASAAIAAYPWLGVTDQRIEVPSRFGVFEDVYNVADPKVYQFIIDVLDEVMALFPSPVIHIGGDEIKYKQWKESAEVAQYMKDNQISSPADLHVFFTNRIAEYITDQGRRMMGWNDIMGHVLHEYQDNNDSKGDIELAKETVVHFWKGDLALMTTAIEDGFDVVNSLHSSTYLDYDYKTIPLSKAYSFDPVPEGLDNKYHEKVIGTGCQMWSEWIPTIGELHYQVFPRIAAYAEVGWTRLEHKDYQRFKSSLTQLQGRWTEKNIYFAPLSIEQGGE